LLRQQAGGYDAGRVAHPGDLDVRIRLLECALICLELVGLQRRVDGELRFLCRRAASDGRYADRGEQLAERRDALNHGSLLRDVFYTAPACWAPAIRCRRRGSSG